MQLSQNTPTMFGLAVRGLDVRRNASRPRETVMLLNMTKIRQIAKCGL
jgi:hypothetical protein